MTSSKTTTPGQRAEFEMSESQFERLLDACKPTPAIWGSGGQPLFGTPQENANNAWRALGNELGFVWDTVQPVSGKGQRVFTAVVAAAVSA